jgi:hypothetical protein
VPQPPRYTICGIVSGPFVAWATPADFLKALLVSCCQPA